LLRRELFAHKSRVEVLRAELERSMREHEMNLDWKKLVEDSLRASEEQYRTLVENMGEGVAVVDLRERFTFANQLAEQIFDVGPGQLVGKSLFDFVSEVTQEKVKFETQQRVEGRSGSYELEIATQKGNRRWILVTAVPYPDNDGNTRYVLGIFRDITDRKENEDKLEEYGEQLQELATELTLTEERERRAIAQVLHDGTGQNLALVMNLLKQLKLRLDTDALRTELDRSIEVIEQTILSTRSLIYDLSPPTLYKFGLPSALDEHFEKFQSNWGIQAEFFASHSIPALPDDLKILLFQSVRELLVNVAKYAQASLVRGYLYFKENEITVLVEDNGSGFEKEDLKRAKRERKGFGLFSIGERLQTFKGHLSINTSPKGTQVVIKVPFKETP
ncbi:PAS domain-containing sensor histidine kinase, partial [Myxococcota bacterium]|nr:PAS domain-containing sensor histidine kinase [Myxococcota bacterium]